MGLEGQEGWAAQCVPVPERLPWRSSGPLPTGVARMKNIVLNSCVIQYNINIWPTGRGECNAKTRFCGKRKLGEHSEQKKREENDDHVRGHCVWVLGVLCARVCVHTPTKLPTRLP